MIKTSCFNFRRFSLRSHPLNSSRRSSLLLVMATEDQHVLARLSTLLVEWDHGKIPDKTHQAFSQWAHSALLATVARLCRREPRQRSGLPCLKVRSRGQHQTQWHLSIVLAARFLVPIRCRELHQALTWEIWGHIRHDSKTAPNVKAANETHTRIANRRLKLRR